MRVKNFNIIALVQYPVVYYYFGWRGVLLYLLLTSEVKYTS